MVAVVHHSSRLDKMLNYNEHKVSEGAAKCLEAAYYPKDAADLNFYQKLERLKKLTDLSTRQVNSVHISLNFDPSEKHSEEKLKAIADSYLQKLGFGGQPYLLYEHYDSEHPHVHIVTTNIKADGSAIELHRIGEIHSERARKAVEIEFGLVKAQEHEQVQKHQIKPVNVGKALYGKSETKRAISGVLNAVIKRYKFTSLPELNAVLKGYNIIADQGGKESRVFKNDGLLYSLLDEQGNKVGIPIKASDFFSKPTMKNLRPKFSKNEAERLRYKSNVKNAIDLALLQKGMTLEGLAGALKGKGIDTVLRQSPGGQLYGITFVDHNTGAVFNGSDIGRNYSAKFLQERCAGTFNTAPKLTTSQYERLPDLRKMTDALLNADEQPQQMDWQLKRQRRKKKKQQPANNQ